MLTMISILKGVMYENTADLQTEDDRKLAGGGGFGSFDIEANRQFEDYHSQAFERFRNGVRRLTRRSHAESEA